MPTTGLTLTRQPPLSPAATVTLDAPAGNVWQRLAAADDVQDALETSVTQLVGDLPPGRRAFVLEDEHGVTALDGAFADAITSFADETPNHDRREQARQLTQDFGADHRSVFWFHAPFKQVADGPIAILRAAERSPTIAVEVGDSFGALRADQRADVVGLLADLAAAVDLRVVATGRWQRKLAREYREALPGVSEQCNARPSTGTIDERAERARDTLDPDGRKVRILRQLASEASETLSYHALYALHETTNGAVRQCLTHGDDSLAGLSLVETFPRATEKGNAVELLAAGRELLDTLDSEIGRQQALSAVVSETGNQPADSRVTPPAHEGPHRPAAEAESGRGAEAVPDRHRLPLHHQVRSAARHCYAAAVGSATDGGISFVDHPIGEKDDRGEPHRFYDPEDDRLLVGAEYDSPMQWWTCIALALANPRTFRDVLPPERIETGKLGDLLANHTDLLRDARCLGYLKDADATAEDYRDALLDAAGDLRDLTKRWKHGDFDCPPEEFRGLITSEALGLAGTLAHLLDLADVDLVREARVPRFSRDFGDDQKIALTETLALGATIQSRYGEFAAYRQLAEPREKKRESVPCPTIDAEDPFGTLIGSFVVVGQSVPDLAEPLRRRLSTQPIHEDAPEFGVRVPVESADERRHTAQTVQAMCRQKALRPTRAAVSVLAALTGTPYDVARGLHNLGAETKAPGRKLRLDEVRYALSALDTDRILPEMSKPALSQIVHTLLTADTPLVQSELAVRADVSARSVRTHTDRLTAFDFIRESDAGWRFALPFHTDEERGETILPWFVASEDEQAAFVRDVFAEVVYEVLAPARYADPDDSVGGALFRPPAEVLPTLRKGWDWLDPWVSAVRTLCDANSGCTHAADERNSSCSEGVVTVGIEPEQTSVTRVE